MLVNDWMNSPVITIDVGDSMQKAVNLMHGNSIGILPGFGRRMGGWWVSSLTGI